MARGAGCRTIPGAARDTVYRAIAKPDSAAGCRTIPKAGPTDRCTNEYPARITIRTGYESRLVSGSFNK